MKVGIETAFSHQHLPDLCLSVFTREAKLYERTYGKSAGSLRRESTVSVKGVKYINYPSVMVCAAGYSASHMDYYEVKVFVLLSVFPCVTPCHSLLVKGMGNSCSLNGFASGNTCYGLQLVYSHGIYDKGFNTDLISKLSCKNAAQIAGMLSLDTLFKVSP